MSKETGYLLVKLSCNYADEFDIESVEVYTQEEYDEAIKVINDYLAEGETISVSFGTNEDVEFSDDITEYLEVENISKKDYDVLLKHVGSTGLVQLNEVHQNVLQSQEEDKTDIETVKKFKQIVEEHPELFTKPIEYNEKYPLIESLIDKKDGIDYNTYYLGGLLTSVYFANELAKNHKDEYFKVISNDRYGHSTQYWLANKFGRDDDTRMIVQYINERFCELTGLELEEEDDED